MKEAEEIEPRPVPSSSSLEDDEMAVKIAEIVDALDQTRSLLDDFIKSTTRCEDGQKPAKRHVKSWWGRHCYPNGRRFLYRNITLITIILQFLNLITLTMIDVMPGHGGEERRMLLSSSVTMIILQLANLIILILATGRLARQVFQHDVNSFFLAQSYLATLLLFAGLYTLTYRLNRHSWKFLNEDLLSDPIQVFNLYIKFLFYSISTATLCGSDNVLPVYWYNHLFAGTQMLLSFCYFASILGMALSPKQPQPKRGSGNRQNQRRNVPAPATDSSSHENTTGASEKQQCKPRRECEQQQQEEILLQDDCIGSDSNQREKQNFLMQQAYRHPLYQQQQQQQKHQAKKQKLMKQLHLRPHSVSAIPLNTSIQNHTGDLILDINDDNIVPLSDDVPLLTDHFGYANGHSIVTIESSCESR